MDLHKAKWRELLGECRNGCPHEVGIRLPSQQRIISLCFHRNHIGRINEENFPLQLYADLNAVGKSRDVLESNFKAFCDWSFRRFADYGR